MQNESLEEDWSAESRETALTELYEGFVSPSKANREIYRVVLETLWPAGASLPGPLISRQGLRDAVDHYRASKGKPPYQDLFRRVRELQGEEGVHGLEKVPGGYRLSHLTVTGKRVPRVSLRGSVWEKVLFVHGNQCAVCGRPGGADSGHALLVPDHKVPRSRLNEPKYQAIDGDAISNLQPLCVNCNTEKSVSCRGCELDCETCPWAHPETYRPVTFRGETLARLSEVAGSMGITSQELAERLVEDRFKRFRAGDVGIEGKK